MLNEPPMTGRDAELRRLLDLMPSLLEGNGGLVLISGEAGIGKTRLASEFEARAGELGCRVAVGGCLPSAAIPYLPFIDAMKDLSLKESTQPRSMAARIATSARKAAPELIKAAPVIGGVVNAAWAVGNEYADLGEAGRQGKEHMLFQMLELLKRESSKSPIVMRIDDLQWADSASLGLLHFLARNLDSVPVLIVGTYRPEEILLDRAEEKHPFLETLRIMRREGLIQEEVDLRPLSETDLAMVVSGMLGKAVSQAVLTRIFKESGGSPLFAVETVRLLESMKVFVLLDGRWNINGPLDNIIPTSVAEVMIRRIERTSSEERRALDYASVIGLQFDPELLAEAMRWDRLRTLEALEHLMDDHQLVIETESGFSFAHEKVRKVAYETISRMRKVEVHRVVGELLEKRLPNDSLYPALATHFDNAGVPQKSARYSYLAGRYCLDLWAVAEALPNFERAVEVGKKIDDFEYRLDSIEGLADANREEGEAEKAAALYESLLRENLGGKRRARALRKLSFLWSPLVLGKGSMDRSKKYVDEALAIPEIDADEKGEIASLLTVVAMLGGDYKEAKKQAALSAEMFRQAGEWKKLSLQLDYCSDVYLSTGEVSEALRIVKEAEEANRTAKDPMAGMEVDFHLGMAYLHQGKPSEAMSHYEAYRSMCKRLGLESAQAIVFLYESILNSLEGDQAKAIELALNGKEIADKLSRTYLKAGLTAALAHAYFARGDTIHCQEFAASAKAIAGGFDRSLRTANIGMVHLASAEAAITQRNWSLADSEFLEAIVTFRFTAIGKLMEALAMQWYGEQLIHQRRVAEAKQQLEGASKIYSVMGNGVQLKRCIDLLRSQELPRACAQN